MNCPICGLACSVVGSHIWARHGFWPHGTAIGSYRCICGKTFPCSDTFEQHLAEVWQEHVVMYEMGAYDVHKVE